MSWLKTTSLEKSKDILEMNGGKAVPLRALIVGGKSNLSNLGGTACVYSLALVFIQGRVFFVHHPAIVDDEQNLASEVREVIVLGITQRYDPNQIVLINEWKSTI